MTVIQKIINGLNIFERYNENTIPFSTGSKAILIVQEVEFGDITDEDRELLRDFGLHNEADLPYVWGLKD